MSGIFYGLEIARRGLAVSQQAITLTGNNISNANTEGYTRQRLVIESLYPNTQSRLSGVVTIGGGAEVTGVSQVRSEYIDRQLRDEYAALGQWNTRSEEMQFIESILNELSKSGSISSALADFYKSLGELTTKPDSVEIRTNLQQNGIKLCETLGYYYDQLVEAQNSYNQAMSVTVNKINNLLTSIASYNEEIYGYEMGGQNANQLRDNRNMLLDELSKLVNIRYSEDADGKLTVSVEGTALVSHTSTTLLTVDDDQTGVVSGESGYYSIYYAGTTTDFEYSGGQLQAYTDLRDGNTVGNIGIPYMLNSLNALARGLAQEFNAVHSGGYTIPYGAGTSQTGVNLFEVPAGGYAAITAGNLSLSEEVLESVYNIAASSKEVDLSASDTQEGNNENALALYALTSSKTLSTVGNFEDYVKSFVVQVGITSAGAQETSESQSTIVENLETRRESISGVSIDEEMINLISYQYAYAAASRVLTTIDEALDVLINRTGKVGL
jgi:flagellar hook-associated protein FlgK